MLVSNSSIQVGSPKTASGSPLSGVGVGGRVASNSNRYAGAYVYAHRNGDANEYSDCDANCDCDRYTHCNRNGDQYPNRNGDEYSDADRDQYRDTNRDQYRNAHAHPHSRLGAVVAKVRVPIPSRLAQIIR